MTAHGAYTAIADLEARDARGRTLLLSALGSLAFLLTGMSLSLGPVAMTAGDVIGGLAAVLQLHDAAPGNEAILAAVRAPRVLLGVSAGIALALSGAVLQALFRNPLVDPGLIGVSAGGALGAASWIVLGSGFTAVLGVLSPVMLTVCAFSGSLIAMSIVSMLGVRSGGLSVTTMLLAGIAINALAFSGLGFLQFIATDAQSRSITFWQMGSLGGANWDVILPSVAVMAAASAYLIRLGAPLDLFTLGEREARHLGCDVELLKRNAIIAAALATGAAVAVSGIIGFVGLVAPHLIRLTGSSRHGSVLPGAALLGIAIVLASDLVARMAVSPAELPIGVVTSFIGAPFFLWLLLRWRGRMP